jgi:hypothetical protein
LAQCPEVKHSLDVQTQQTERPLRAIERSNKEQQETDECDEFTPRLNNARTNKHTSDRIPAPSQGGRESYTEVSAVSLEIVDGMLPTKPTLLNNLHPKHTHRSVPYSARRDPYTTFGRNSRLASRPVLKGHPRSGRRRAGFWHMDRTQGGIMERRG